MLKVKNIVISGTNFWNPGDDFVRDGVIRILHEIFPDYVLNFLFYNFNQDFFPQSKFEGIHNMAAKGDLEKYKDFVDYVVIAGLSAGDEIKDLYNWIIENDLTSKVFLIGAGYENNYVDNHIYQEPELTIFKNAKIITSRTLKAPKIIHELSLPFYHINCPAILSVPQVKEIQPNKKIERIAFSIQLPHEIGIPNHSCSKEMYVLSIQLLAELYGKYEIEIIAHHKLEYFHFLNLLKDYNINIPVIFSSYYQDLFEVYKRYDLISTTRLHASLFANGFGIPGIIINDTDRHTHCLEGFKHSHWVNDKQKFFGTLEEIKKNSLVTIAKELELFKKNLLTRYIEVLSEPFGVSLLNPIATQNDESIEEKIVDFFKIEASNIEVKKRVLAVFEKLEKDYWLNNNITNYKKAITHNSNLAFDTVAFLNWFARTFQPQTYLEVGVRRGRSMAQVISESKNTKVVGIDLWIKDYSTIPGENIITTNPGPEFVLSELEQFGIFNSPLLLKGSSQILLPEYFSSKDSIKYFDLILVDGDHTYEGARFDLEMCIPHLAEGGVLIFDDINHDSHPELKILWTEMKTEHPDYLFFEDVSGTGTGILVKPPFKKYLNNLNKQVPKNIGCNKNNKSLPIHFFTIVLNGKPFINYHIDVFKNLPFRWHWHIVEGVADLKHDTAWSLENNGKISDEIHLNGHSKDGTSEYINELINLYPENITIYQKNENEFWDGKIEMINKPLENINEDCLLWQVDVDELWTTKQIIDTRNLFLDNPEKTAAYFYCNYFVGEKRIIVTNNTYGNHTNFEWLRVWNFKPGDKWLSHEPPKLIRKISDNISIDLGKEKVITHNETKNYNLIFQHYSYATEEQLLFKEIYYGYNNPLNKWRELNEVASLPVRLKDYFEWVDDNAIVEDISKINLKPLAYKIKGKWQFEKNTEEDYVSEKLFLGSNDYCLEAEGKITNNELDKAKYLLRIALSLDENNINALNDLAVVEIMNEDYTSAVSILNRILIIDPLNEVAKDNLNILNEILKQHLNPGSIELDNMQSKKNILPEEK